jgi:hypothetical protein
LETNKTNEAEDPAEELTWLKNLQRNSWEPEVIISGLSLAFIFAFPAQVYDFSVKLTQDFGLEFTGAYLVLIYLTMTIGVFKIFFISHLVLRFTWAGLLGLSYAFPDGVINENLFKRSREYHYRKPQQMVLKLERFCSMAFAFPMMMGIIFSGFTLYLSMLLFLYWFFDLNFFLIYIIFMASLIGFALFSSFSKKNKLKKWLFSTIFYTVQATYQSNLGKWAIIVYTFFIMGLTLPFIKSDAQGFFKYANAANLDGDDLEWADNSLYFEDKKEPKKRFPRAIMPSDKVSGEMTTISLAHYEEDSKNLNLIIEKFNSIPDSLGWHAIEKPQDLYRIYVNGIQVSNKNSDWRKLVIGTSGQKAYQFILNIKELDTGVHEIRIEKIVLLGALGFSDPEIRYKKNWAKFTFVKVTS